MVPAPGCTLGNNWNCRFRGLHAFNLSHGFCGDRLMVDYQACENQRDNPVNDPEGTPSFQMVNVGRSF
jgi:hypothetical protein